MDNSRFSTDGRSDGWSFPRCTRVLPRLPPALSWSVTPVAPGVSLGMRDIFHDSTLKEMAIHAPQTKPPMPAGPAITLILH